MGLSIVFRAILGTLAVGLGVLVFVILVPEARAVTLDLYLLLTGTVAVFVLVELMRLVQTRARGSLFERALRRPARNPRALDELVRLEAHVLLSTNRAFDFHQRLRPILREIAAHRLSAHHGLELERGGPRVQALLGSDVWNVVRPGVEPPEDRLGPGISRDTLARIVDRLERV